MYDVEKNVNASWQLVSQFVSWDFCRYMCEQNEKQTSEFDVLTFFRNVVVERTEKAVSDITKHEIVAKLVLESRSIRTKSQMSCITPLADTVKRICPELKAQVAKLVHHLENLLNVLDWNEDSEREELILARMSHAVGEFATEACKALPLPNLLQVVKSWMNPELLSQVWKSRLKCMANIELYKQALKCLQEEVITTTEAKTIALALYGDKALQNFILNTDNDAESESTDLSQANPEPSSRSSSQFKQQSNPSGSLSLDTLRHHKSSIFEASASTLSQQSLEPADQVKMTQAIQDLGSLDPIESFLFKPSNPEPLFQPDKTLPPDDDNNSLALNFLSHPGTGVGSSRLSSVTMSPIDRNLDSLDSDSSRLNKSANNSLVRTFHRDFDSHFSPKTLLKRGDDLQSSSSSSPLKNSRKIPRALLSDGESIDEEPIVSQIPTKSKILDKSRPFDNSEEPIDEDVIEIPIVPQVSTNFSPTTRTRLETSFYVGHYSDSDTSDCDKNSDIRFLTPTIYKKDYVPDDNPPNVVWLSDEETNGSNITCSPIAVIRNDPTSRGSSRTTGSDDFSLRPPKKRLKTRKPQICKTQPEITKNITTKSPRQKTLQGFFFSSANSIPTQNVEKEAAEKKRYKLFDTDVLPKAADESALFEKNPSKRKQKPKKKAINLGNKRRCPDCGKVFRTPLELKKHVFIQHTTDDLNTTEDFSD